VANATEITEAAAESAQGGGNGNGDDNAGDGNGADTACDSSYPDDCIPSPPPDLDCGDDGVPENFEVLPPDPHNFDPDNDGIGCESESNQQSDLDEEPRSPGSSDSLTLGDLISRAINQLNSDPLWDETKIWSQKGKNLKLCTESEPDQEQKRYGMDYSGKVIRVLAKLKDQLE
jgi:hypothetical protein